jgi:hypothetical protein
MKHPRALGLLPRHVRLDLVYRGKDLDTTPTVEVAGLGEPDGALAACRRSCRRSLEHLHLLRRVLASGVHNDAHRGEAVQADSSSPCIVGKVDGEAGLRADLPVCRKFVHQLACPHRVVVCVSICKVKGLSITAPPQIEGVLTLTSRAPPRTPRERVAHEITAVSWEHRVQSHAAPRRRGGGGRR